MSVEDKEPPNPEQTGHNDVNQKQGLAAWLMEISRETASMMNDGRTIKEMFDELYDDETGLPK
ncbi:MAG: hypothetical protein ABSD67_14960 [Terracidiphilus sp.]|jgi:hypothetical protein